ncbi:styrene monooxygenase/indole monooxygenase family protein [Kibdelosporangium aridum]|uniref:styrene monooxygenase/indole monooxygenase family protein n=1 Tax=Kibdelosporangium aridum TaxID=2030 RepID=UPI0035E4D5BA
MGMRLLVVGAGETALQMAAHIRNGGGHATVLTPTPPEAVAASPVRSTQVKVWRTRGQERSLGFDLWPEAPQIRGIWCQAVEQGRVLFEWRGTLTNPAVSVNQPDRFAAWLGILDDRGVRIHAETRQPITAAYVDRLAQDHDLVVITTSPKDSDLAELFPADPAFPALPPARQLLAVYLDGVEPTPGNYVQLALLPEGEILLIPAYFGDRTTSEGRTCHVVLMEARPGTALDTFRDVKDPAARSELLLRLLREFAPSVAARCGRATLADARGTLAGAVTPVVRQPVSHLPLSGRPVASLGDLAIRMDPLAAQGANSHSDGAAIFARRALAHSGPFDEAFLTACSDEWRQQRAYPASRLTSLLLEPPPPVRQLLAEAAGQPELADTIVRLFETPWALEQLLSAPVG